MINGKRGTGISKHRKSGKTSKSPKERFRQKLEAEKNEKKASPSYCTFRSIQDLMGDKK